MTHRQKAPHQHVVVSIAEFLEEGLPVFDVGGERLGRVDRFSLAADYLKMKHVLLFSQDLYVPFHLIKTIDPRELFLKIPRETLLAHYALPPAMTITVEHVEVPGPDGTPSVHVREQRRVRSGYDQTEVILDSIDLNHIAEQLAVGMAVDDADGERVGRLTQYDSVRALMVVERGLTPRAFFIPFSAIAQVDASAMVVSLLAPKAILERDYTALPSTSISGQTQLLDPTFL